MLAGSCFHAAYASLKFPAAGLLIFGYAYFLVRLTDQPNVRRAFYFGLGTGYFCYAPQLFFMWKIFNVFAVLLWFVLAFWIGLFTAIICGCNLRWGKRKTAWLIPVVWTGIEYFRSELYYLKFSWLNIGYIFPNYACVPLINFGMYGLGFFIVSLVVFLIHCAKCQQLLRDWIIVIFVLLFGYAFLVTVFMSVRYKDPTPVSMVGVQLEFPNEGILPKVLTQALAKNPNAQIFVLSEYTLNEHPGGVPDVLKNWCRDHAKFLVVGGKSFVTNEIYYNTAFVVGTNGDLVFQQAKSVPIQFFADGLPAPKQEVWNSPWGKVGICICYDLSYARVTDELVRQGAQLLIVPTMDVEVWGRHQHELHSRIAPVRAAEYGLPIFRLASSGISQAVDGGGKVSAHTSMPGNGEILAAQLLLPTRGSLPLDRTLAPICTALTGIILAALLLLEWKAARSNSKLAVAPDN